MAAFIIKGYTDTSMKKLRKGILVCAILSLFFVSGATRQVSAQEALSPEVTTMDETQQFDNLVLDPSLFPPDQFYRGEVITAEKKTTTRPDGNEEKYQDTRVRITNGPEEGKEFSFKHSGVYASYETGDKVVVVKVTVGDETSYAIADNYRLDAIVVVLLIFLAAVIFIGRTRGFMSILGLAFSILVLVKFVVPRIMAGGDPLVTTLLASLAIMVVSLLLAHGFETRTFIALGSTAITLGIAVIVALITVSATKLFGLGSEDAAFLQLGVLGNVNFRGLLLGGIIIGTLGVLDDVTTTQTASVEEISKAGGQLGTAELYKRGLSVGREHIASLINTLVLAYAGASLPLFLLFTINKAIPLWVTLNGETIAEEVIRTLVGSFALILAVPISTAFAALVFGRKTSGAPVAVINQKS